MKSGIYRWLCIPTGKRYIGQAFDLKKRKRQFLNFSSRYSSKSDNIEGVDAARAEYPKKKYWDYIILKKCPEPELNKWEKKYIDFFLSNEEGFGYNLTAGGTTGTKGYKHTEDTRRRLSEKQVRFQANLSEETKKARCIHASSCVDRQNPVYRKHLSEALMGHKESAETREKIRCSQEKNMKAVAKLDRNLSIIDEYKSVADAARDIMRDSTNKEFRRCYAAVKNCLNPNNPAKTARGYYYKLI